MLWQRLTPLYDDGEAKAIVRMVMEERFGLSFADILCGKTDSLSDVERQELEQIMCRLEKGEPVQYVLGTAIFCGRQFHVAPGVLIPRPETEKLVRGWGAIPSTLDPRPSTILDIGTGSGCIAITLALENPDAYVEAWDISEEALAIARDNAKRLGANVVFKKVDILNPRLSTLDFDLRSTSVATRHTESELSPALAAPSVRPFTTIISNPPYICEKERATMETNVLNYEPETALFVPDDDPLLFYRHIADFALTGLQADGELRFETNPLYVEDVAAMLKEKGFTNVTIHPDQFGKQRFVRGHHPKN